MAKTNGNNQQQNKPKAPTNMKTFVAEVTEVAAEVKEKIKALANAEYISVSTNVPNGRRWRAGVEFSDTPSVLAVADLSQEQFESICADSHLKVKECTAPETT